MVPLLATEEQRGSDVDLLIVGKAEADRSLPALQKLETRFRREFNVTLYSPREFPGSWLRGHFLSSVLKGKTVLLKGSLE